MTMGMGEGMGPAEVRGARRRDDAVPCARRAEELLHGCARVERLSDGWVRPWRVLPSQMRALESCLAWYPGIFRQMGACTAGVTLEFDTDASRVVVEVRVDPEPNATRAVLRGVDGAGERLPHDGISADVDGRHLCVRLPGAPATPQAGARRPESPHVTFELDDDALGGDLLRLPGFGTTRRVRVWLPSLRGCELGWVRGDGTVLEPVAARPALLVLGDSLSQGYVVDDPALSWPSVASAALGCDVINQSIGAQVFQPSSLTGAEALDAQVERVVVMLGANYRYGRCSAGVVSREVSEQLEHVLRLWPGASAWVVVPPAAMAGPDPVRGSCFAEVPGVIAQACERAARRREERGCAPLAVVDGAWLLDGVETCDADGHPTAAGAALVAQRMLAVLDPARAASGEPGGSQGDPGAAPGGAAASACACERDFGQRGRCGACGTTEPPEPDARAKPRRHRSSSKRGSKSRRSR